MVPTVEVEQLLVPRSALTDTMDWKLLESISARLGVNNTREVNVSVDSMPMNDFGLTSGR